MRLIVAASFLSLLLISDSSGQGVSRDQRLEEINQLRSRLASMEADILRPNKTDLDLACEQGLQALRLLPREKYENSLTVRGGGAYYSFAHATHEYGRGSDLELQSGHLSVGFAGADYGFLHDLGAVDLNPALRDLPVVRFLSDYKPPSGEGAVRAEQARSHRYEGNGFLYQRRVPVVVGNSYVLRSINFSDSDVLVAFKIVRQDPDGSIIIFWDLIESFGKRPIDRAVANILQ